MLRRNNHDRLSGDFRVGLAGRRRRVRRGRWRQRCRDRRDRPHLGSGRAYDVRTGPAARIPAESPLSAERTSSGAQDDEEPRQTEFSCRASTRACPTAIGVGNGRRANHHGDNRDCDRRERPLSVRAPATPAVSRTSTGPGSCGYERWPVKTLADRGAAALRFINRKPVAVRGLVRLPVTRGGQTTRGGIAERTVFRIHAQLLAAKVESDSDIHLDDRRPADEADDDRRDSGVRLHTRRNRLGAQVDGESPCGILKGLRRPRFRQLHALQTARQRDDHRRRILRLQPRPARRCPERDRTAPGNGDHCSRLSVTLSAEPSSRQQEGRSVRPGTRLQRWSAWTSSCTLAPVLLPVHARDSLTELIVVRSRRSGVVCPRHEA